MARHHPVEVAVAGSLPVRVAASACGNPYSAWAVEASDRDPRSGSPVARSTVSLVGRPSRLPVRSAGADADLISRSSSVRFTGRVRPRGPKDTASVYETEGAGSIPAGGTRSVRSECPDRSRLSQRADEVSRSLVSEAVAPPWPASRIFFTAHQDWVTLASCSDNGVKTGDSSSCRHAAVAESGTAVVF